MFVYLTKRATWHVTYSLTTEKLTNIFKLSTTIEISGFDCLIKGVLIVFALTFLFQGEELVDEPGKCCFCRKRPSTFTSVIFIPVNKGMYVSV